MQSSAMASRAFFSFAACFVLLLSLCLAHADQGECQVRRMEALRPTRRLESQAGFSELWDENDEQFDCAGVATSRHTIQPRGLLLPTYSSAPRLIYVVQGEGYGGVVLPGCPESFQSFEISQSRQSSRRFGREESERGQRGSRHSEEEVRRYSQRGDEHQKIHSLRQGDVIALPAGISAWAYNNGDRPLILVVVLDTSNFANQLDRNKRVFFLAGSLPQESRTSRHEEAESTPRKESESRRRSRRSSHENFRSIFSGFDARILSESFGIDEETAQKLRNSDERNGFIVKVEKGLQVAKPRRGEQEEREYERERRRRGEQEQEREYESEERRRRSSSSRGSSSDENGVEEPFCNAKLHENIGKPSRADIYTQQGGHLTTLNSRKLPILYYLKLSAERGHLRRNAILAPHWNTNSHSIVYAIRGRARMQIVDNTGSAVFDGRIEEGEMVVVPMNFAVVKQAEDDDFEWISFKTNEFAATSPLAGRTSVIRGLPEDVLVNAYRISREEARRLKYGRDEVVVLSPRSRSSEEGRASQ